MNITIEEAAARLGRSPSLVQRLITQGRLKAVRFGYTWVLTEAEVDRFAALERPPGRPPKAKP